MHARRRGQTGLNEVLGLAEAQLLDLLRLLSGLNRPFPARSVTIHRPERPVKSVSLDVDMDNELHEIVNYPRPLGF